ncbi:MAG: hypothetical protein WBA46_16165 [Thermomicrobiales bacterium]
MHVGVTTLWAVQDPRVAGDTEGIVQGLYWKGFGLTKTRRSILSLVAMVALFGSMLAHGSMAAMAQDTTGSDFQLSDLKGIQQGVSRDYMGDMSAMMAAYSTPSADSETPDLSSIGLFSVSTIVLKFDSEDNAKAGLDTMKGEMTSPEATGGVELKEESVDGLPDNTTAMSAQVSESGFSGNVFLIGSQQDEYIYYTFAMSLADDDSAKNAAVDFTKFMVDASAGDGEGTFNEDGTSSGGVWDKLATNDDDVLNGLTVSADAQIYPES